MLLKYSVSSSAAGIINTTANFDISAYGEFASVAAMFDEFRVVGGRIKCFCAAPNSNVLTVGPVVAAFDNDDAAAVTSYSGAAEYKEKLEFASIWDNNKIPTLTFTRPSSGLDTSINWIDCGASASSLGSIKFYGDSLSLSTLYFTVIQEIWVQFRGER
jgi:hypothetical protein